MKKACLIGLFVYCFVFLNAQNNNIEKDIPKYIMALNHIQNDTINKNKKITASNMVVDLNRAFFRTELLENNLLPKSEIDSLTIKFSWFDEFRSSELSKAFAPFNKQRSENIVFFSLIEKNTLRADLFWNNDSKSTDFNKVVGTQNDKAYAYLFVFENENIKTQFRFEVHYEPF